MKYTLYGTRKFENSTPTEMSGAIKKKEATNRKTIRVSESAWFVILPSFTTSR